MLAAAMAFGFTGHPLFAAPLRHELRIPEHTGDPRRWAPAKPHRPASSGGDTIWIADWTFDDGAPCNDAGWDRVDNYILNDGSLYWRVDDRFDGLGTITGKSASVGILTVCEPCAASYGNDWYQAIRMHYVGPSVLSFDYVIDAETNFDFLYVEVDSACASFDRVDLHGLPGDLSIRYRTRLFRASGLDTSVTARVDSLVLPDFGSPDSHCVYVSFNSDGGFSPCDGLWPPTLPGGVGIDNIDLAGAVQVHENFETPSQLAVDFVNLQEKSPFGEWARVYPHVTDNDACSENRTCAWLFTDDTTPALATDPDMAFGPGHFVIQKWLDDAIISPWTSLAGVPSPLGTVLSFRNFPGNNFVLSCTVLNWSIRSRTRVDNTDTPDPGDSTYCVKPWQHAFSWSVLNLFSWITQVADIGSLIDPQADEIQVRFRVTDWGRITQCLQFFPVMGPGPFIDRVRIGAVPLQGPTLRVGTDARSQAQDGFATEPRVHSGDPAQELFQPSTDRFGTAAFTSAVDLDIFAPSVLSGDSITIEVLDARGTGGIPSVEWYGSIVSGPHRGKAPPPFTTGANGFFVVAAESALTTFGTFRDSWFVDLDDDYFRGGDVLHYFWLARDALGGVNSSPPGLHTVPASHAAAEAATGGLWEVSFLPTIDWDPGFLWRIAADPHGKLDPTPEELAGSRQANCILYYQGVDVRRLSGDANRTSFMYTLDKLGYRGLYDVYDHQGLGNTNNHLGGRATVDQATGYALIVYDAGNRAPTGTILPDGGGSSRKIDQSTWFRDWLAQAPASEAGVHTLWILAANALEERAMDPLYQIDMGVLSDGAWQSASLNPGVVGQATVTFSTGVPLDFSGQDFQLTSGDCTAPTSYDALEASGTSVVTHRYRRPVSGNLVEGAAVMKADPAASTNTILMSFPWFEIVEAQPDSAALPESLLAPILRAVLPPTCQQASDPTDVGPGDGGGGDPGPDGDNLVRRTALHPAVPNPFNPRTRIRYDLASGGPVTLRIYDLAGRSVRTLVEAPRPAGRHQIFWDGRDDHGRPAASGVYFYRLTTPNTLLTRKMLLVR